MEKKKQLAVVHYHEIALKGKNRAFFEKALVSNIEKMLTRPAKEGLELVRSQNDLGSSGDVRVWRISGRILVEFSSDVSLVQEVLKRVFGIRYFAFAKKVKADIDEIKRESMSFFEEPYPESFRIKATRSEKDYPFTSQDIAIEAGAYIQKNTNIKVDLVNPELTVFIEVVQGNALLYDKKIQGPGGLPIGTAGKVVSLISPGFDSPIASLKMMKRGCEVEFVHFHSYPQTTRDSIESVEKIVGVLAQFSPNPLKLHMVPFLDIQKRIIKDVPNALAIIMYRRWMLKIAEILAKTSDAKVLITGDSIGQVASQTLDNIVTISEAVTMPILRPLAGDDKEEIINETRSIGTYKLSSLPFDDCCNLFTSGSPETHSKIEYVKRAEDPIKDELEELAEDALADREVKVIK